LLQEVNAMVAKEIRKKAGKSMAWVAVMAGTSEPTAKLYELAGPEAVREEKREALRRVYAQLEAGLKKGGAK